MRRDEIDKKGGEDAGLKGGGTKGEEAKMPG
jgi:hypothetical protein